MNCGVYYIYYKLNNRAIYFPIFIIKLLHHFAYFEAKSSSLLPLLLVSSFYTNPEIHNL